jgi:transcriptional regulator with XRE-family HTH domain
MKFGKRLKEARKHHQKTLREVAANAGITISYVSDMENGRRIASVDVIQKIEAYLEVKDGSLVAAARKEKDFDVPSEAKALFWKRPELNMALLRASQDYSEEHINKLIKTLVNESDTDEE